jgi:hypothetical protein
MRTHFLKRELVATVTKRLSIIYTDIFKQITMKCEDQQPFCGSEPRCRSFFVALHFTCFDVALRCCRLNLTISILNTETYSSTPKQIFLHWALISDLACRVGPSKGVFSHQVKLELVRSDWLPPSSQQATSLSTRSRVRSKPAQLHPVYLTA